MDPIGKNVFKGIVLHKVSRENAWGPTLFWGLVLYSPTFRKVVLVCIVGVILIWLWGLSPEESKDVTKTASSPPADTQEVIAPPELPQEHTSSIAIEPPTTPPKIAIEEVEAPQDTAQVGVSSQSMAEARKLNSSTSVCEVTEALSSSQTCKNSSVLALTSRYETLVSSVDVEGKLTGGNYAEDQKVKRLLTECDNDQCKTDVLFSAIDIFKAEVLK